MKYESSEWYWQSSFIGKSKLATLQVEDAEEYNEEEMFGLNNPLKIIVDDPGMGKSTLLKYFAQKAKNE